MGLLGALLFIFLLFTWPLITVVIRYRAHYAPRSVFLPPGDPAPLAVLDLTGPEIRGMWQLAKRVKAHEGRRGFFRGLCPEIVGYVLGAGCIAVVSWAIRGWPYLHIPQFGMISGSLVWMKEFGWNVFSMVVSLPMGLIVTRAITTPYSLSYSPIACLRVLLSPTEFSAPWQLYTLPGLFLSKLLLLVYLTIVIPLARIILLPALFFSPVKVMSPLDIARVLAYVLFLLASVAIVCPLEIISLRLQLQPQGLEPAVDMVHETTVLFGKDQRVIQLRFPESVTGGRYIGVLDCLRKIRAEEGWRVLARAWWITALSLLNVGLGAVLSP